MQKPNIRDALTQRSEENYKAIYGNDPGLTYDAMFGLKSGVPGLQAKSDSEYAAVPFSLMDDFPGHPFRLYEGERLDDMVESIRSKGILQPLILRAMDRRYQILSGHNRKYAGLKAGLTEGPAVIKRNLTDNEAWVYVVETNLMQRSFSDMAHSEKAAVIAAQHSKLFSQGKRNDILVELKMLENPHEHRESGTFTQVAQKSHSDRRIAEMYSLSKDTVARYLRIHKLIPALKTRLDDGGIAFIPAVTLSFLKENEQALLDKCLDLNGFTADMKKADILRQYSEKGKLDDDSIYLILSGEAIQKPKLNRVPTVKVSKNVYVKYFKPNQPAKEIQKIVERRWSYISAISKSKGGRHMLMIITNNPVFGKGYFIGFNKDGFAAFQSCCDKRTRRYKLSRNAERALCRIKNQPTDFVDTATYEIVPATGNTFANPGYV